MLPLLLLSQSIEVSSFNSNPLEINPLTGGNLTINYKYTSEAGSTGNHIYIGLEILDSNNSYISTVVDLTLENQQPGTNVTNSIDFFLSSNNTLSENLAEGYYYQVKTILYASDSWTGIAWSGSWDTPKTILQDTSGVTPRTNSISKGADISWMTEMENSGFTWKDNFGTPKDLMPLLKEHQINAIRLRVWVNPSISDANGWCDINDMVNKAKLAKAQGMDIMICIHYSDHWADPGKQTKPTSWANKSVSELETAVYNHTTDILTALNAEGIIPKWVQIGNETNDGMLWPEGKASTAGFVNYAKYIKAGNNAVKSFNNSIKTIVHVANGNDNELFKWNIGGLINNGAEFDIIGMSLYPEESSWKNLVDDTYSNMLDMKSRYGKDIMIAEVGFNSQRPEIAHQFIVYMIEKTRQAEGIGVFYWEPIAHLNWKSYSKGAWKEDGSPSIAMNAFIDNSSLSVFNFNTTNAKKKGLILYPNPSNDKLYFKIENSNIKSLTIFNYLGKKLKTIDNLKNKDSIDFTSLPKGIYMLITNTKESFKIIK